MPTRGVGMGVARRGRCPRRAWECLKSRPSAKIRAEHPLFGSKGARTCLDAGGLLGHHAAFGGNRGGVVDGPLVCRGRRPNRWSGAALRAEPTGGDPPPIDGPLASKPKVRRAAMIGLALLIAATSLVVARVHAWLVLPYLLLMAWILLNPRGGSRAKAGPPTTPEAPATPNPDPVERPGWFARKSHRRDPPSPTPRAGHPDAPSRRGSAIVGWFERRQAPPVDDSAGDPEREPAPLDAPKAPPDTDSADPSNSKESTAVETPLKTRKRRRRRAVEPEPEPEPSEIVWVRVGPSQFVRQEIPAVASEGEEARREPADAPPPFESPAPTADQPNDPATSTQGPADPSGLLSPAAPEPESTPAIPEAFDDDPRSDDSFTEAEHDRSLPDLVESSEASEAVEASRFAEPTSEFDAPSTDDDPEREIGDDRWETSEDADDEFNGGTLSSPPTEDATGPDAPSHPPEVLPDDGGPRLPSVPDVDDETDDDEPDLEDDGPADDEPDRPEASGGPDRGTGGPETEEPDIEDDSADDPDRRLDIIDDKDEDDDRWDEDDDWDDDAAALAEAIAGDAAGPAPGPPPEAFIDRGSQESAGGVVGYGQDFQSYLQDLIQMAGGVDGPAMQALGPPPSGSPVRSSPPPVPVLEGTTAPTPREPEATESDGDRGPAGDDEDDASGARATVRAPDAFSGSADPSPPCPDEPRTSRDAPSATSEDLGAPSIMESPRCSAIAKAPAPSRRPEDLDPTRDATQSLFRKSPRVETGTGSGRLRPVPVPSSTADGPKMGTGTSRARSQSPFSGRTELSGNDSQRSIGLLTPGTALSRAVEADRPAAAPLDRPDRGDADRSTRRNDESHRPRPLGDQTPRRCHAPRSNRPRAPPRTRDPVASGAPRTALALARTQGRCDLRMRAPTTLRNARHGRDPCPRMRYGTTGRATRLGDGVGRDPSPATRPPCQSSNGSGVDAPGLANRAVDARPSPSKPGPIGNCRLESASDRSRPRPSGTRLNAHPDSDSRHDPPPHAPPARARPHH